MVDTVVRKDMNRAQKNRMNRTTNQKKKIDIFEAIYQVDESCSKLKGVEYIKCVKENMRKQGLDEKTINEVVKSEILGFDL